MCSIIALLIPFAGIIYICLFSCNRNFRMSSQRKRKAFKILYITTIVGLIIWTTFILLLSFHIIKIDFIN